MKPLSGCKAILFDFGGTLDSDGEHWLDRFYELYEKTGLDLPKHEIKRVFYSADEKCCRDPEVNGMGLRALMTYHVHLQFTELNLRDPRKERDLVEEFCAKTEGVLRRNAQLLSRLSGAYRLGVVSNFYGNVDTLCHEAGLGKFLGVILDSTQMGISKPNPAIFRIAVEKLGVVAEEAIFVGDSYERDIVPSRQLGMKTVWMKGPNPRLPEGPEMVDLVISNLPQLAAAAL